MNGKKARMLRSKAKAITGSDTVDVSYEDKYIRDYEFRKVLTSRVMTPNCTREIYQGMK